MENLKPLIIDSLELLLIGMGSVFMILTCLIFLVTWTSKFFSGFEDTRPKRASHSPAANIQTSDESELIAVISAAIHRYKNRT